MDMQLTEGMCFENYYWMEGPLPGDVGKRIVVLHNGQATHSVVTASADLVVAALLWV